MDPVESLGRLVLSLGLIVGVLLLVRHWAQRSRGLTGGGAGIRVVARTALTRTSVVAVVEADGRRFLIGAADQGVRLLGELEPDDTQAALAVQASTGAVPATRSTRSTRTAAPNGAFASPTDGGTLRSTARPRMGLLDRLRGMTVRTHVDRPIRVPLR
jgi:flagellar biogenesis protein FliO